MVKRVFKVTKRTVFVAIAIAIMISVGCLLIAIPQHAALIAAHAMECKSRMKWLAASVENDKILRKQESPPFFGSWDESKEFWSWRIVALREEPFFNQINLHEPWNSECNLSLVEKTNFSQYFTCPCDFPKEQRATYIAVTGPGTAWNELRKGRTQNLHDLSDMILFIETSEPKNHWAEPGDDVSPEEVIRMFESDPGLVKNSKQGVFSSEHYPKYFVTVIGTCHSFGEISNVDELKQRLLISSGISSMVENE